MDEKVGIFFVIHAYVFSMEYTSFLYLIIYILLYEVSTWKTEELANLKIFTLKTGDINIV